MSYCIACSVSCGGGVQEKYLIQMEALLTRAVSKMEAGSFLLYATSGLEKTPACPLIVILVFLSTNNVWHSWPSLCFFLLIIN